MIFYHRTNRASAKAILAEGFKDSTDRYLTRRKYSGVWLSSRPLDANEGLEGEVLLRVDVGLTEQELADYEWAEEGKGLS